METKFNCSDQKININAKCEDYNKELPKSVVITKNNLYLDEKLYGKILQIKDLGHSIKVSLKMISKNKYLNGMVREIFITKKTPQ